MEIITTDFTTVWKENYGVIGWTLWSPPRYWSIYANYKLIVKSSYV